MRLIRLASISFTFPVIGALAGQIPVLDGTYGGVLNNSEKSSYAKNDVVLSNAISNASSVSSARVVENSGICDTAPLALWFNGGPGSSSMIGLFQEHGPCRITNDSSSVTLNPYSWNNRANMLYIDQPIGVGFSHGDPSVGTSQQAASDVWTFMQLFFNDTRFAKYQRNDLAIWTESYFLSQNAAITAGSLQGHKLNLKVLGIGNGLTDPLAQYPGYAAYAASNPYHPLVNSAVIDDANKAWSDPGGCKDQVYYVLTPTPDPYPPDITNYLNSISPKIGAETKWTETNTDVYSSFASTGDWMRNSRPALESVIDAGVRTIIFDGDADYILNYVGVEAMQEFATWNVAGQPAGQYKEAGPFSYLRVFGAGHEVSAYKHGTLETGQAAAQMFTTVMAGQTLSNDAKNGDTESGDSDTKSGDTKGGDTKDSSASTISAQISLVAAGFSLIYHYLL
ncbi:hypothetical protein C0995_001087 [Termitomyces sp. Mi166|nr:hypothetical protein C0995_001087 [Termitomyces sp. Mi166\